MEDFVYLAKTAGPKMLLFLKTAVLYFVLVTPEKDGALWTTTLKCAPILSLMLFIFLCGVSFKEEHTYPRRIFLGLIFSLIGDIYLNMDLFPHGMAAFAVAQATYISAFGFKPLRMRIGIGLYLFAILFVALIINKLDEILFVGLPIYAFLLSTMAWRALALIGTGHDSKSNLAKKITGIGSLLFVISDGFIAVNRFMTPIPNAWIYVMITYYAAQFAITLSILAQRTSGSFKDVRKTKKIK